MPGEPEIRAGSIDDRTPRIDETCDLWADCDAAYGYRAHKWLLLLGRPPARLARWRWRRFRGWFKRVCAGRRGRQSVRTLGSVQRARRGTDEGPGTRASPSAFRRCPVEPAPDV